MNVIDLSDLNRIDEMSRLIFGHLLLHALIQGGRGLRCHPKGGRIEVLGTAEKDMLGTLATKEANAVGEVTSELKSLGLFDAGPGAPTAFLLRINDLETVVTLVPSDVDHVDAFDLQFQGSAELSEAALSVYRHQSPRTLLIREGRIVGRVAGPYRVPPRLRSAPLRLFAWGIGKLSGRSRPGSTSSV